MNSTANALSSAFSYRLLLPCRNYSCFKIAIRSSSTNTSPCSLYNSIRRDIATSSSNLVGVVPSCKWQQKYYNYYYYINRFTTSTTGNSNTIVSFENDNDTVVENNRTQHNHELLKEQLLELKLEREALFGFTEEERINWSSATTRAHHKSDNKPSQSFEKTTQDEMVANTSGSSMHNHGLFEEQLLELKLERESLFGFTEEERTNWSSAVRANATNPKEPLQNTEETYPASHNSEFMQRTVVENVKNRTASSTLSSTADDQHHQFFTHLTSSGNSIKMVDVGSKLPTNRLARARTKVLLPPEVMVAFSISKDGDLVGPKGPIFATAKVAGIMASKRTSELIPLCHPLSLDKCHIDITLDRNEIIIECECSVTHHKTGVEMEALIGASIAALTIYDMVKAVSHRVRIESTELIIKTGGKRDVMIDHKEE